MGTVIVDLDSTLCDTMHRHERSPHAHPDNTWYTFGETCDQDLPLVGQVGLVRLLAKEHTIRIVSGRGDVFLDKTCEWLRRHEVPFDSVHLRSESHPDDHAGYKEMQLLRIMQTDDVVLAIDDWPTVVEMYHRHGIPCVCVNPMYRDDPMMFFTERSADLRAAATTLGEINGTPQH